MRTNREKYLVACWELPEHTPVWGRKYQTRISNSVVFCAQNSEEREEVPRESRERNPLPLCPAVAQNGGKRGADLECILSFRNPSLPGYSGYSCTWHRSRHEKPLWRLV